MKNLKLFGVRGMCWSTLALLLSLITGCGEEGLPDQEGVEVALILVPDIPRYSSLNLIEAPWQLVGFVNEKKSTIKLAKRAREASYTLTFEKDGTLSGYASINMIYGLYTLGQDRGNSIDIAPFGPMTYMNEVFDGPSFIELVKKASLYRISPKGLGLYYSPRQYLLFRPLK